MDKKNIEKLSVVEVGGKTYLGNVEEKNGKVVISNALPLRGSEPNQADMKTYIKASNLNELKNFTFRGNGSFMTSELDDYQKANFASLCDAFAIAQKIAPRTIENDQFDRLTQ